MRYVVPFGLNSVMRQALRVRGVSNNIIFPAVLSSKSLIRGVSRHICARASEVLCLRDPAFIDKINSKAGCCASLCIFPLKVQCLFRYVLSKIPLSWCLPAPASGTPTHAQGTSTHAYILSALTSRCASFMHLST